MRCLCAFALLLAFAGNAAAQGDAKRGEYLAAAGGCIACHTEHRDGAVPFAGGRAIETSFGTFYGPNITPDPQAGIGGWQESDFFAAMRRGVRPDGRHYYPAFPFTSFTGITDADLRDLWAYLKALPPSNQASRPHDLAFPFNVRALMAPWAWLFLREGPFVGDPDRPAQVQRGAYLLQALGHCDQCHTPRNVFGALKTDRHLAGVPGEGGKRIPNLTPTRLGEWSDEQLRELLLAGITPDFESVNAAMSEVIDNTTSKLTPEDLAALVAYLRTVPPLPE